VKIRAIKIPFDNEVLKKYLVPVKSNVYSELLKQLPDDTVLYEIKIGSFSTNVYNMVFVSESFKEVDEKSIPEVVMYLSTDCKGEITTSRLDGIELHMEGKEAVTPSAVEPVKTHKDALRDFFFKEHHPKCTCGQKTIKDAYHLDSCPERHKEVKQ